MNTLFDILPWELLDDWARDDGHLMNAIRSVANRASGRFPPVNLWLDENAAVLEARLPGKTAADVDLTLESDVVVLADKPAPAKEGEESRRSAWTRRIKLPFEVDASKISAAFKNGILRVELPKAVRKDHHRIEITNG